MTIDPVNPFDAIRPYHDHEVRPVLDRLLCDRNFLLLMARFKSPRLAQYLPLLAQWAVEYFLRSELRAVASVADLQKVISKYVQQVVDQTTTQVSFSGLEPLSPSHAHLFMSNHRDIVFDPALVNFGLFKNQFPTARIAIGDNLLKSRLVAEMMRLNKSFVVKRNLTSPREMRDTFFTLSSYINESIRAGESIWIAQQEGRAKDGNDRTDPAIIKMFHMSRKKADASFAESIRQLRIVPVAISYEYDPCDQAKAKELEERARTGGYQKSENEDVGSIVSGIKGHKGRVHVAFGTPLNGNYASAKEVADAVDEQILRNYRLYPSNYLAYQQLRSAHPERGLPLLDPEYSDAELFAEQAVFDQRLAQCPPALRSYMVEMYANPVISRLAVE